MQKMNTITPTVNHVFHAFGMKFQSTLANLCHRIEAHLETRRLQRLQRDAGEFGRAREGDPRAQRAALTSASTDA